MEEQEPPLEDVHEAIQHHAEHARERWMQAVALSTALLAAVAAIASLLSGDNVNEAMLEQIQAADKWNQYQAKGIKSGELATRIEVLKGNGKPTDAERKKLERYAEQQRQIEVEAHELEASSTHHMARHHVIAKSVTWSQIAIAISAISVLTRQRWFWLVGLAFGVAGLAFLIWGMVI